MGLGNEFGKGLLKENPSFRLLLGMCPTLAVSLAVINGIGMGLAATVVLVGSNLLISALRRFIPSTIRIPCYIVIIAGFVTIVDLSMAAFVPGLHKVLGIFIPLIVVNCIILGRAEAFAQRNGVLPSMADGLGMGLGFTLALMALGFIRELLGTGAVFSAPDFGFQGIRVFKADYSALMMILPPGAFLTLGFVLGGLNYLSMRKPSERRFSFWGLATIGKKGNRTGGNGI